jgi:phosphonate metabolism protein PhnN/1,5-bisphosphokinase (PRPP-forming)
MGRTIVEPIGPAAQGAEAGMLVLVVGASGAGKDTLINAGRAALAGDPRFVFVRRTVTRPVSVEAEDHESLSPEAFSARAARGDFALTWQAHGLSYGLPRSIVDDVMAGRIVIANVSRAVIEAARSLPGRHSVVHVTARAEILARRLAARGREPPEGIAGRIRQSQAAAPIDAVEIRNNGTIEDAAETFVALLRHLAEINRTTTPR